jgi:hypothetical protein
MTDHGSYRTYDARVDVCLRQYDYTFRALQTYTKAKLCAIALLLIVLGAALLLPGFGTASSLVTVTTSAFLLGLFVLVTYIDIRAVSLKKLLLITEKKLGVLLRDRRALAFFRDLNFFNRRNVVNRLVTRFGPLLLLATTVGTADYQQQVARSPFERRVVVAAALVFSALCIGWIRYISVRRINRSSRLVYREHLKSLRSHDRSGIA